MKYYLMEITTYVDGTADSKGIYEYADKDLAIANFHSKMGGAMKNENYASELLKVTDSDGNDIKKEKYTRPVAPTPDPEPEVVDPEPEVDPEEA